ncbi:MAG: hypothetical protein KAJ78_02130 [Acidobacteria bacterium]|nr:hypothetical protein [Acidobacteriota bacterium]
MRFTRKNMIIAAAVGFVAIIATMGLSTAGAASDASLSSPAGALPGPAFPPVQENRATEVLFRGDFGAEIGLGCSNGTGNSGGPNDWAVGVTATLTPPFGIVSTTYNIFTGMGYTTALTFKAWAGGAAPGAEIGAQSGMPMGTGNYTVAVAPPIMLSAQAFYFGFYQPQSTAGMRIGLDTSSGSEGTSFLLAPGCGLGAWGTVDSIGFAGNWVMRAVVDDTIPVELMTFTAE